MIAFIVNPIAAGGRGKKVWSKIEPVLRQRDISYTIHYTERRGHAVSLAKTVIKDTRVKAVVAVGGDGTVHEVAQELVGKNCPLGFIPCGSGNDLARALDIPINCIQALERILAHRPQKFDIAEINGHYFVNGSGIGFDAAVAKITNESRGKQWLNKVKCGRFVYLFNALRMVTAFRPTDMALIIDGERVYYDNVWLVAVCNIPFYAGGMKICPEAVCDDGILDVCIVNNMSRLYLLRNLAKVFKGNHVKARGVTMLKARTIQVKPVQELYVHTDGESYQTSPVTITARQQALTVL